MLHYTLLKVLPITNTVAYWAKSKLRRKQSVVNMFPDSPKSYRNILQDKQLEEGNAEKSEQPEAKRVRQRTGEEKSCFNVVQNDTHFLPIRIVSFHKSFSI